MKIAIVHDYLKEYGGAERVLETLHEIFPDAPVFTTVYLPKYLGPHRERFERSGKLGKSGKWDVRTSFLQYFPFKAKLISPFRLLSPLAFKSFDFSDFDIVITSATGAYFPNTVRCYPERSEGSRDSSVTPQNDKRTKLICYCHTPPRYLYGYHTARDWKRNPMIRVIGEIANHFLRIADFNASKNVDFYIANSEEVASRIKKFYRRSSTIIYPPVDTQDTKILRNKDIKGEKSPNILISQYPNISEYYLAGGRLARAKGTDIIIDAFSELGLPLKIFGKGFGGFENELEANSEKRKASSNIEFLGEVSDEEKLELMRNAKAFIFASYDEDFGITPVEAMSVGTPVIAYKSGGVKETVIDGKTGLFYNKNTAEELARAVQKFETMNIDSKDCIRQAEKFSRERFKESILKFIDSHGF